MEELKKEFLDVAFEYYEQYVANYSRSANIKPYLLLPVSYIEFAKEETNLFQLLFISDMALNMSETNDFYKEIGNEGKANVRNDRSTTRERKRDISGPVSLLAWYCCFVSDWKTDI